MKWSPMPPETAEDAKPAPSEPTGRFHVARPLPESLQKFDHLGTGKDFEDEIFEIMDRIWLFEDLSREEVSQLCAEMECLAASPGDKILAEGDSGDFLVIILTGEVAVVKSNQEGEARLIANVGPGASLGEMSLIDGLPRFASCIAREPTDFAVLSRDNLSDILIFNPSLGNKVLLILLQIMSKRLRETGQKLLPFISGIYV